jgi:eukaryotic-like serine/threonine-protein kinase
MPLPTRLALEVIIRHAGRIVGRCLVRRGRYVIGQDKKNEIVVNAESVSGRHARLTVMSDTELFIEDLESANGVSVDGQRVEGSVQIGLDSLVAIGEATLEFQRGGIPAAIFPHLPEGCLRLPRYRIGEVVVQGSTSAIYSAYDTALCRNVAMKVMLPESQSQSRQALRFIREAQIAGQLQHPGILPIYEFGRDDEGRLQCVTRFVEGESFASLLDALAEGHAPQPGMGELIGILLRACEAVAFAHSRGVVHCALDPGAITVGHFGEVFVGGWGFARILPAGEAAAPLVSAPESPAWPGLTRYTAPEQAEGSNDAIDARTDIHALGGILYRLITLRDAVTGETEDELLDQALSPRPAPATALAKQPPCPHWPGGKLPESLASIAMKALSVDREERHASVEELQREIAAWHGGVSGGEHGGLWKQFSGILGRH